MTVNSIQSIFPAGARPDVRAKVVDHTLVATFRTSNPPTVWRMDLEKNHSFAVAIQRSGTDWMLGVMSPKGEFTAVANFSDRDSVDRAMEEVEGAMFSNPNSTGVKVWRVSAMTAAMVAIIILGYTMLASVMPVTPPPAAAVMSSANLARTPPPSAPAPQSLGRGVPIDADAFLGNGKE